MKKLLFTMALGLFSMAANAQADMKPVGGTGPLISVDKEVIEYGTVQLGADGERNFTITNTGDAPLILTNCSASCGCTVPQCTKEPIKPGASSTVTVKYDTKRPGPFNKTVTITSNATNEPTKTIKVAGIVEGAAAHGHEGHDHSGHEGHDH